MSSSNFKPLPAPYDAIRVEVFRGSWGFLITYRAPSRAALLAAECITQFMIDKQLSDPRGLRGRIDADGFRFQLRKRPTKSELDRCVLYRWIDFDRGGSEAKALAFPGVADYLRNQEPPKPDGLAVLLSRCARVAGTTAALRTRAVGRFQRTVRYVAAGAVIFPDWPTIQACATTGRMEAP